ncbi:uncharacterized protein SCHCODRAFT_02587995 [Schizophyllum commune H4-8]|uniref:uncharacterized protein n=1 Tax=Schizophyllum commune (strain H4-8 / FGSC 9210) TaxID=578458 RepID=UPI0021606134|nr:uncharacterized protein SCHCODRAFT_02587995 [Schizophyllum commune H4-8]KAI5888639.1 hypothetical protein SCHCODRAFT_02587995 [Schizophyllum commune H4-8]
MSSAPGATERKSHKRRKIDSSEDTLFRHRPFTSKQSELSTDGRRVQRVTTHISAPRHAPAATSSSSSSSLPTRTPGDEFDFTQGDRFFELFRDAEPVVHDIPPAPTVEQADAELDWESVRSEYLDETFRYEGRGSRTSCSGCNSQDAFYRCRDQCMGHWLYCRDCIVKAHALLPTHWLEEWNPEHECFRRSSLKRLGQVVQLGHPPGECCIQADRGHSDFTVIDTNGVHIVAVQFCGCGKSAENHRQQLMRVGWWPGTIKNPQTCATLACLRQFHKLNACSKISIHEFWRAIERLTDNTGTIHIKSKRQVFASMINHFRHVVMLRRFGRAHVDDGVSTTPQGGLAIRCPACPEPGRNLPRGWQEAGPDTSFLYQKFIAQDANFRLANAVRSSEARNPPLGDGWAYFVKREPYLKYVSSFASEGDISTCSGFAAIFLANAKRVRGLRATGVAAVICSRHNMFLPNGMGDLQKGERFCNMTYVLASALAHEEVPNVVYSYDVACVFDKKLKDRIATLPATIQGRIADMVLRYFVPNFHLPAHRAACHALYSFHFGLGVGRTHGETVEENWFLLNKSAAQTKPMGPGTRQLTLEDHGGCHNHEMDVSLGRLLPRRLVKSVVSFMDSYNEYEQLRDGVEKRNAPLVQEWLETESKWQQDRTSVPCPYEFTTKVRNLRDVELSLRQQETQHTADGTPVPQEMTVTSFIKLGIDVQHAQRLLALEVKAINNPTSSQQLAILNKRVALRKSVDKLRAWQRTFMPLLQDNLSSADLATYNRIPEAIENIRLFLPSELTDAARAAACAPHVAKTEIAFRTAEAEECLEDLRRGLRIRTATNQYRQANVRQIGAATRARQAFDKLAKRIHTSKVRYRFARNCLLHLRGPGDWERRLRVLQDEDVRALNERALTSEEKAQRAAGRSLAADTDWTAADGVILAGVVNAGEGSRRLSWIWYMDSGQGAGDAELNEALRVEFLKSKARRDRDREETQLLLEEMRRTIASLDHDAEQWQQRAHARTTCDELVKDGLRSYALEQSMVCIERATVLEAKWKRPREAARLALELLFDKVGELTDEDARQDLEDALDGVERDELDDLEDEEFRVDSLDIKMDPHLPRDAPKLGFDVSHQPSCSLPPSPVALRVDCITLTSFFFTPVAAAAAVGHALRLYDPESSTIALNSASVQHLLRSLHDRSTGPLQCPSCTLPITLIYTLTSSSPPAPAMDASTHPKTLCRVHAMIHGTSVPPYAYMQASCLVGMS